MGDLDTYRDKIIVFEAVKASDTSRLVTRQPLQPTTAQIFSPPGGSSRKFASFDGASDENTTPVSAILHDALQPSRATHGQVRSRLTPEMGATTPLSTSDHTGGTADMSGFDQYYASWRDRIQVSYPDYDDGMHVFAFRVLSISNM